VKVFVCSDIHANLRALEAVLGIYRSIYPCRFLFLGDCIGYGSHPDACLDRILQLPHAGYVMGNHEQALLDGRKRADMSEFAAQALNWSESILEGRYDEAFTERFRMKIVNDLFYAVHASPCAPEEWGYLYSSYDARDAFMSEDFHLCFVGHTHVPSVFTEDSSQLFVEEGTVLQLKKGERYIVNPGSVGQPRDGNPKGSFCVFDPEEGTIAFQRCQYDVEAEVQDILRAGLPKYLGDRLVEGY
jgi:predicted phosphodiesterase